MEKVYTALNAHEPRSTQRRVVLKGIFGYSKKEIDEGDAKNTQLG